MNCLYAMPGQQNREGCEQLVCVKVDLIQQKCDRAADVAQESEIEVKLGGRHCALDLWSPVLKLGNV